MSSIIFRPTDPQKSCINACTHTFTHACCDSPWRLLVLSISTGRRRQRRRCRWRRRRQVRVLGGVYQARCAGERELVDQRPAKRGKTKVKERRTRGHLRLQGEGPGEWVRAWTGSFFISRPPPAALCPTWLSTESSCVCVCVCVRWFFYGWAYVSKYIGALFFRCSAICGGFFFQTWTCGRVWAELFCAPRLSVSDRSFVKLRLCFVGFFLFNTIASWVYFFQE